MKQDPQVPALSIEEATRLLRNQYGLTGGLSKLVSYSDQNFQVDCDTGARYLLKIANADESAAVLEMQNEALLYLPDEIPHLQLPQPQPGIDGQLLQQLKGQSDLIHHVRLLSWVDGTFIHQLPQWPPCLPQEIGSFMAKLDLALSKYTHPAAQRDYIWDLKRASGLRRYLPYVQNPQRQALAEKFIWLFETVALPRLKELRQSVIHNDGNDYNLLVEPDVEGNWTVSGLIDFGDMMETPLVCEPAIAAAYASLEKPDPWKTALELFSGYNDVLPLQTEEAELLFYLMAARLCTTVVMSAERQAVTLGNEYLKVTVEPAWRVLEQLNMLNQEKAVADCLLLCGHTPAAETGQLTRSEIITLRKRHLPDALALSYREPLHIVRGEGQYLYDDTGRVYLDAVNNVPVVGHCHPRVVQAAHEQMRELNTNTRYLHQNLVRYCQRLCDTMPEPLSVCFVVNSGSEANDLALRLASAHTGGKDWIVLEGAYHGNLNSLIEISPYKYDGPGGAGEGAHVHKAPLPDTYRGPFGPADPEAGLKYARLLEPLLTGIEQQGRKCAAFICESLAGCGGQVELPAGFLRRAADLVHDRGGLYIADEVQVGFGRTGDNFWGFQSDEVVPDIVTIGKPAGNGHPLAAVVTSPEIAASFANGMEYFNTYGGNPVSCAVGLEVLNVIRDERLQEKAKQVGSYLKEQLLQLKDAYPLIGDVRGRGLFLGVELVTDRATREPAEAAAVEIVELMKEAGILISTDGALGNVLKIKPPLVFSMENADHLVAALEKAFCTL
jgi:4-aminobutyrate aminotransferase-like enzyme/Ser/Thr protein kinase RdoA (MazF antagonist)